MAAFGGAGCRRSSAEAIHGSETSPERLRHIDPRFDCRDRRFRLLLRATALPTRLESPKAHAALAAGAASAARAKFLRRLSFGCLRSLIFFFARSTASDLASAFGIFHWIGLAILLPMLRQTQQFSGWHFDQREHLSALRNQRVVPRSHNAKST